MAQMLELLSARCSLIACNGDYATARRTFQWPCHSKFNFVDGSYAVANRGEQGLVRIVQLDGAEDGLIYGASSAGSSVALSFQRDTWHHRVDTGLRPNECWEDDSAEPLAEIAS